MLATIVSEKFLTHERDLIASSLDEICSPDDSFGWSSAGIYCFWDSRNSEILYIGLAVNLPRRFREHAGLIPHGPDGCKKTQIDEYFAANPGVPLGYSVLLQSPMDQPDLRPRAIRTGSPGDTGRENIQTNEGLLIQAHKLTKGGLPRWNKIGGDKDGAGMATQGHEPIFNFLSEINKSCPFRAELPLRDLAKDGNAICVAEEERLHAIRMLALNWGVDLKQALQISQSHTQKYLGGTDDALEYPGCQTWIGKWCK
jgi:hypothetical protein